MGWIGNLFGTDNAINNVVDKDNGLLVRAGSALGNLHYSDQEKANTGIQIQNLAVARLKALEPFKVMQRIMVTIIMTMWAFLGLNIVVGIWLEALFPKLDVVMALVDLAQSEYMWWPTLAAVTLYLGGGVFPSRK
jgi:hypothetical protein